MHVDPKTGKLARICRQCKKPVPLEKFYTRRTKICIPCQIKRRLDAVKFYEDTRNFVPVGRGVPAITSTREGRAKYARERNRNAKAKANADQPMPMVLAPYKLCRTCHRVRPASKFESWRVRICLACDGQPILPPR